MTRPFVVTAALLLAAGCSPEPVDDGDAIGPVELVRVSYADWQQKLESWPPDIVVVDMWATWCVSCLERFPKMVEMHEKYRDRGVRFVSLCLDERSDTDAIEFAITFLEESGASFEHYLMDENLMVAFEKLDLIGIPAVVIYDRSGMESHRLTGDDPNNQFDDTDVEAAVAALLNP